MATLYPARAAAESREAAQRIRLTHRHVYSCRFCHESVTVTNDSALPAVCPSCHASTWEDDGRCGAWNDCSAEHRDDGHHHAHCPSCGYSIWAPVERGD